MKKLYLSRLAWSVLSRYYARTMGRLPARSFMNAHFARHDAE